MNKINNDIFDIFFIFLYQHKDEEDQKNFFGSFRVLDVLKLV